MDWLLAAFGATLDAALGALFDRIFTRKYKKRSKELERLLKEGYRPRKIPEGTRKNTVLMIGLGRVGKTQLIDTFHSRKPQTRNRSEV